MIQVVLIDDEPNALESLKWEIETFCKHVSVLKLFTNPHEALDFLSSADDIDCIFLDIEMPGLDGLQLLDKLPQRDFAVIITTAYDQYAISAIKERALDYLLKPIDSEDLVAAIEKVEEFKRSTDLKDRFEETLLKMVSNIPSSQRQISLNSDGKIFFLKPEEIIYCEADGSYTKIHIENSSPHLVSITLKKVEEKLTGPEFFRVHNSFIVNLTKVREYVKTDSYLLLQNQAKIPVARQRKSVFLEKF